MMTSPFDRHRQSPPPAGNWHVGETRTINAKEYPRQLHITRTARPFIEDWVDAANIADREQLEAKGLIWVAHRDGYSTLRSRRHMSAREQQTVPVRKALPHWQERETEPA